MKFCLEKLNVLHLEVVCERLWCRVAVYVSGETSSDSSELRFHSGEIKVSPDVDVMSTSGETRV